MAEIKFQIPEGYDGIDKEKSNFEEGIIVLKKKELTPWRHTNPKVQGFFVTGCDSTIGETLRPVQWLGGNENVFVSSQQARSMRAMAQLSQIIQNDERFGGAVTDEEWTRSGYKKYVIIRGDNHVEVVAHFTYCYFFLAFHTEEQAELFLKENEDLIRQYYMLD